ncbi:hemagglutination activity domain protein [Leptolyngbya sp. Heron Island J]|uniref:CHAT domain-containing protein n=1 Tax=Leptolyngbya sp. Heron Island J TaxID=1385935 RepID=UPI0003B9A09B|nr:CHAT domain-containing protein [Leptolyngbya sp. Heron Island J]ESA39106.1 hemagglutination activity domain protein [Leptolyngbya sp. Heron Island J]
MAPRAKAQVVSAQDSVQTQVVQQDNQFVILGGTTADDGSLLFHSFEQFDLGRNQIAEFQIAPNIETVFSRITNGVPSRIDGMIDLGSSLANLYLMNPAGVLFGADAAFNLAGDFTAVTAERLAFEQGDFGLIGSPRDVQGNILQLYFNSDTPGTIVNLGDLRVGSNRSLSLIGHSVVNQGTLSGGTIDIVAVGSHQEVTLANGLQFTPAASAQILPPWLSATGAEHASEIEIQPDGSLRLTGSYLSEIPAGTALIGGELITTGSPDRIRILGDYIATVGARLATAGGGQILIGCDSQGEGTLPTTRSIFIDAASTLTADGELGGQIVIGADGLTQFMGAISAQGDVAGGTVEISGQGQLDFSGLVDLRSRGTPGTLLLDSEDINIRAGSDPGNIGTNGDQGLYEDTLESSILGDINVVLQADNSITIAPLSDGELTFAPGTGRINLLADADGDGQGRVAIAPNNRLSAPGRDIFVTAAEISVGDFNTSNFSSIDNAEHGGHICLIATHGNIVGGELMSMARGTLNNRGNGGDITLSAAEAITVDNIMTVASALSNSGNAGEITLTTQTGPISTGRLNASTAGNNNIGAGGNITLGAVDNISTGDITTSANATTNNSGQGGNILLTSQMANISTASLAADTVANSSNTGNSGSIVLEASAGAINSQQITATAVSPDAAATQGGDIQINADGAIVIDFINAMGQGQGGDIDVATQQSFRATDAIANLGASLLTTGDGTIDITYNSDPKIAFTLGDSETNGTVGSITTGIDTLTAPQTVAQAVQLESIELNNLFESLSGPSMGFGPAAPVAQTNPTATEPQISPILESLDSLELLNLETLNLFNNAQREITDNTHNHQERTISNSELIWAQIEMAFSHEFAKALNLPMPALPSLPSTQQTLRQVNEAQNIGPALLYVRLKDTHIELVLIKGDGAPVYRPVAATAAEVQAVVATFHQTITNPMLRPAQYLPAAQQLYDWLIRPMLDDLETANIDHIGFVLDSGLRSLPMAALHDGQRFLVENYSLGVLPSAGLTSLEPSLKLLSDQSEQQATLAMGVANFGNQADLAAVPFELELASQRQHDERYLDHDATLTALRQRLERGHFTNVHLATHAVFQPGSLENSYVQLWDQTISLEQLQQFPLDRVDFLILSACATALGDPTAEFGFAGLAVNVGVQTALASLWSISDEGTLGLMSEFYRALEQPGTRSAALRQAQLAMIQGHVGIADGTVYGAGARTVGHLPELSTSGHWDFSHPAYWSGFVMIGNPW